MSNNQETVNNMVTNPSRPLGNVRLFACGGLGVNLARQLEYLADEENPGFATLQIAYVDTSSSNITPDISQDKVYLIEGLDGSGQKRSQNSEHIIPRIKDIIQNFKPADLNIVLHSLSGGSGSVIGALLAKELLLEEAPVVVIAVGDSSTRMFTQNTLNALKSYEAIAHQTDAPINMIYRYNNGSESKTEVDKYIINAINDLTALFSNQHLGLDSRDLFHFLRYEKVTDIEPQLSYLSVTLGDEKLHEIAGSAISVATLATEKQSSDYTHPVEYHTVGSITEEVNKLLYDKPTHFVISDGFFDVIAKQLKENLNSIDKEKQSRVRRSSLISDKDNIDDSGLVL